MWDKTFIYILILFIFVGIFAYDQYIIEKGQVGLVSQLIDYLNISEFKDPPNTFVTKIQERFYFDYKNLDRLRDRYHRIERKRAQLIQNREEILRKIKQLNLEVEQEGMIYADVIYDEATEFLSYYPDLKQIQMDILDAKIEPDPVVKEKKYSKIQWELYDMLKSIVKDPQDMERLTKIFNVAGDIIEGVPDVLIAECADITLEECIRKSQDVEEDLIEMIHTIISGIDIDLTHKFTELLYEEFQIQAAKYDSGEKSLKENDQIVKSRFKELVKSLDKTLVKDLKELKRLHSALERDQRLLLKYLRKRNDASRNKYIQKYRDIMKLNYASVYAIPRIGGKIDIDLADIDHRVIERIRNNEEKISELFSSVALTNHDFFIDYQQVVMNYERKKDLSKAADQRIVDGTIQSNENDLHKMREDHRLREFYE